MINVGHAGTVNQSLVSITIGQATVKTTQPIRGSVINLEHAEEINQIGTRYIVETDGSNTMEQGVNEAYEALENGDLL